MIMPALLHQRKGIIRNIRIEDRVQIDVFEIAEVGIVRAGDRIDRFVRIGHRVQEGVDAALGQLHKGLLDRVFARSAQNRMLHDMGDARAVVRGRPESDLENLVSVVRSDDRKSRSGFFMLELDQFGIEYV